MEPFSPVGPEFRHDPYAVYRRYRERDPVHRSIANSALTNRAETPGFWYLFRHADVAEVLRDPRFGRELHRVLPPEFFPVLPASQKPFYEMAAKWMLLRDPPDHTRLRALVNRAFTPVTVERLRPRIAAHADLLLDAVEPDKAMDVIADFAFPLPLATIAELLGVRVQDRAQFRAWSNALSAAIDQNRTPGVYERASQATVELSELFRHIIRERRQHPQNDLISALIAAEEQGSQLSEDEVVATCILMLGAGQETTVDLIGNSVLALLQHPEQLELLRAAALVRPAVEELLRYESPVQMTARVALEDVEIGGQVVRKGSRITLVIGSANRDPDVFPDPDDLDLTRNAKAHLCFGLGSHFCVGAPLARAGGQIAISTLLRRFPHLRLVSEAPEWRETTAFRGLKRLAVSF